jgi:cephalosporin-C deacetylase-like acetyl esterase
MPHAKVVATLLFSIICVGLIARPVCAADELAVLPVGTGSDSSKQMLARYLKKLAFNALQRRGEAYEKIKTPVQAVAYQERLRAAFIEHLGGFPKRTPLNPQVVGKIDGDGYRIEKLIYESQPRHHVTAVLFLPKSSPPYPAVLVPCGHSSTGKAAQQRVCILLAKHGIAALSYDPIGQAERVQLLDANGKARFKMTTEHTLVGAGSIPLGRNTATFRIWDGMRSIDYLASRSDINAERIGVTGCSGGGTLTSYLMALDGRVVCAAPSCYITSWRRLIETIGPQDAEQNIHGQLEFGMDHADYMIMRAPKPTIVLASTHDFFDIEGTWASFRQAKQFYTRLGFAERLHLIETDAKHGYPKLQREAMVSWMRRWLLNIDEPVTEQDFETHKSQELQCSPDGQVLLMEGARSIVDLNVAHNNQLKLRRREKWSEEHRATTLGEVRKIAGIRPLAKLPRPNVRQLETIDRSGYSIRKIIIEPEAGIQLPALLFQPDKKNGKRSLYVHGAGKQAGVGPDGEIEKLVLAGNTVLAVDLRGSGETGPTAGGMWGGNWDDVFLSYLLGRSFVGMRAEDILNSARYLSELDDADDPVRVELIAIDGACPPAMHAAALENELFHSLKVSQPDFTWSDIVRDPSIKGQLANTVHGALSVYDLDDLLASFKASVQSRGKANK